MNCPLCPFPERPHSLVLRSVRLPRLKQGSEVNIATVLAPAPLTLTLTLGSPEPEAFPLVRQPLSPLGPGSLDPIRAFLSATVCPSVDF